MSTAVLEPVAAARPAEGGAPARRAVVRWAWRLFRREWRQQLLILALITVAVAATIVGSAVATNNPPPKNSGFGTAQDSVSFTTYDAHAAGVITTLEHRFGRVELIENETQSIPGSINTYQLRAQDPHGPFSGPMLSLVSGHFPSGTDQVAVTSGVASAFHLRVGTTWRVGGVERQVVGIVENPQSLLDEFALVAPGQVASPTGITALFDAPGAPLQLDWQPRADPRFGRAVESDQPRDDLTCRPRARHAAHRPRLRRWLHGPCTAPPSLNRDARVDRRDRPPCPAGRQRQRHGRRTRRCDPRLRARPRRLARLPSEPGAELSPRHRRARALVGGGDRGDGARCRGGLLRGVPSGAGDHQGADRPGAVGPTGTASPGPPHRAPRHRLPRPLLPLARLFRWHESRQRWRRRTGASLRDRPPHPRADPARSVLPVVGRAPRPPCPDRSPARAARSGPVSRPLGLGARRDQRRGARRGDRDARCRVPVWKRPRLCGSEPRLKSALAQRQPATTAGDEGEGTERQSGRPVHDDGG